MVLVSDNTWELEIATNDIIDFNSCQGDASNILSCYDEFRLDVTGM